MSRPLLFVGSYAPKTDTGITVLALDEPGPALQPVGHIGGIEIPSFLTVHPDGNTLYAVSETGAAGGGSPGSVFAVRVRHSGAGTDLEILNHQPSGGDYPCNLRMDATGRWLAVSNYGTGTVAVLPIEASGELGAAASVVRHKGSGPNLDRQKGPHAHAAIFTPDNRFLIAADLGIDRLVVYRFNHGTGALHLHHEVRTAPGAGPRHLTFDARGRHVFVVNELANTVTLYDYQPEAGSFCERQTVPTLPEGAPPSTAADIHTSGDHVYVTNRGHDSVTVYSFDPDDGLRQTAVRPCGGRRPRSFAVTGTGGHLIVANRDSNEVVVLPLLEQGADLGAPVARVPVSQPSSVVLA